MFVHFLSNSSTSVFLIESNYHLDTHWAFSTCTFLLTLIHFLKGHLTPHLSRPQHLHPDYVLKRMTSLMAPGNNPFFWVSRTLVTSTSFHKLWFVIQHYFYKIINVRNKYLITFGNLNINMLKAILINISPSHITWNAALIVELMLYKASKGTKGISPNTLWENTCLW